MSLIRHLNDVPSQFETFTGEFPLTLLFSTTFGIEGRQGVEARFNQGRSIGILHAGNSRQVLIRGLLLSPVQYNRLRELFPALTRHADEAA